MKGNEKNEIKNNILQNDQRYAALYHWTTTKFFPFSSSSKETVLVRLVVYGYGENVFFERSTSFYNFSISGKNEVYS